MNQTNPWLAKLAAWTHDPAEKSLVLMRDPAGHEGGTVRELRKILFPQGIPADIKAAMKRADHWAAAADRPQFGGSGRQSWAQVRFEEQPVLIHPLSGEEFDLIKLADIDPAHIKALSGQHFDELIVSENGVIDTRKTALNFWRFGPELDQSTLPTLWKMLPADTRVPDHTIWSHLDLSSAFATAFTADANNDAALLSMSFGPVQDFIAAARTTSDLWAGSHLLSRLAWEGLKVIATEIGPDAVLFPQLRGIPQVDLWLRDTIGLPKDRFAKAEWANTPTDANPLFMAALPNKFVAIVPADQAAALADKVTTAVRHWVKNTTQEMLKELLEKASIAYTPDLPCHAQLTAQLAGFPEVHWASVPFSLITADADGKALAEQSQLAKASRPFLGNIDAPGFLGSEVWRVLAKTIEIDGARIFTPNPGVLYPAIYDLLDRVAAAAKAVRPFSQTRHEGYRCDLTGEAEWLTTDRAQLSYGKTGRKDAPTLWNAAAKALPGLFRKGEHLSAIAMLKRLWPRQFVCEISSVIGKDMGRYVISTHTMALATSLEKWIDADGGKLAPSNLLEAAKTPTALPLRLMRKLSGKCEATRQLAKGIPAWLDDDNDDDTQRETKQKEIAKLLGCKPEAYYAFILLDGDKMGAWLSGTEEDYNLPYAKTWHPKIRAAAQGKFPQLDAYLKADRAVSPARHMAISAALNDFALHMARHVVEDLCKGKLLYAGGDDVLAMVSVDDLLRCLFLLRLAYSGIWPDAEGLAELLGVLGERKMAKLKRGHALLDSKMAKLKHGHALLDNKLLRLMGNKATASAGAVVAHHQAPLANVLRELRKTEKRAKMEGGRDAFSINLLKRSGGAVQLTLPWLTPGSTWPTALEGNLTDTPMALLLKLRDIFSGNTSRKAAYLTQGWLTDLPTTRQIGMQPLQAMIAANLEYQLKRQGGKDNAEANAATARLLVDTASRIAAQRKSEPAPIIRDLLGIAEFLARESRTGNMGEMA
ncbi:MAG: type III-B CRISPR-associated protein Cas10/Cmr2 [Candidatus Dechloromonas phosphoritropha]|jgi:CRISPR-associated protein Cmr2|nr:type III-B CRISPR-associated protein Cas10/Cmr2 [Candidatus Dechloromonas phosphoritropha]MBP8787681.1 type III-B CRISPR-associated protein Cas10/Cmr2 [Azonexus sp.]MBP9228227.1 type III-B CRISPR-associated protein Cas10/Cmr2 [Azonexus sp.]